MKCSKFSTGAYVEKLGVREKALCNKGFNNVNVDKQFNWNRPAFRSGDRANVNNNVEMPKNKRTGDGNRNMVRNNFISPPIRGREELDFEKLQAQDISEGGIKVQLGDKTIEQLFKIQVPDPTDIEWLDEYNRRIDGGETPDNLVQMPPFGRPQRQVSQTKNFAQQGESVNNQVEILTAAVLQGHTETKEQMAEITASVARILGSNNNLQQLSRSNMGSLQEIIRRMNVPKNYRSAGFLHQLFDLAQYRNEQGLVNLYLLSNVPADRTLNNPLVKYDAQGVVLSRTPITGVVNALQAVPARNVVGHFLNLGDRSIITRSTAIRLVQRGVDNGQLGGRDPPPGGWV
jgi:hypothetical protein